MPKVIGSKGQRSPLQLIGDGKKQLGGKPPKAFTLRALRTWSPKGKKTK